MPARNVTKLRVLLSVAASPLLTASRKRYCAEGLSPRTTSSTSLFCVVNTGAHRGDEPLCQYSVVRETGPALTSTDAPNRTRVDPTTAGATTVASDGVAVGAGVGAVAVTHTGHTPARSPAMPAEAPSTQTNAQATATMGRIDTHASDRIKAARRLPHIPSAHLDCAGHRPAPPSGWRCQARCHISDTLALTRHDGSVPDSQLVELVLSQLSYVHTGC